MDPTKLDTLQFGYWMQLQKQSKTGSIQGTQSLNNYIHTNAIAFDNEAWMTQFGVDATIEHYHAGFSVGQTQGSVLAHNEERDVTSTTKGRTLGIYAASLDAGQTIALSIQKGWFTHQALHEGNYDSDTLITKFTLAYPVTLSASSALPMSLSPTIDLTHQQYEDSLIGTSTHSSTYQGKVGLKLSATGLPKLTPFVALNYHFGTSKDLVFNTINKNNEHIGFTMPAQAIPSSFGLETGFNYLINDQWILQSLFDYHQVKDQNKDLESAWDMSHSLTYRFKDNISIEAHERTEQDQFNYGVSLIWHW